MNNKEYLEWLKAYILKEKRKDFKKKLKENYYDNRLNGGKKNESK